MGFRIENSDFADLLMMADMQSITDSHAGVQEVNLGMPKGEMTFVEQSLSAGVSVFQSRYHMHNDVIIAGKGESQLLELQFNLSEEPIFYKDKRGQQLSSVGNSGNISFLPADDNQAEILFREGKIYQTFDIHVPVSMLSQYQGESKRLDTFLSSIYNDRADKLWKNNIAISPEIYSAIQDMRNCRYDGLTRKIYLESKTYELLALLYSGSDEKRNTSMNNSDVERVKWAAALLRQHIDSPITIVELARRTGVNQTKLKEDFKAVIGNTIFGYQQTLRMDLARDYLRDTKMSIQEISFRLGYQNSSNFSSAFKKIHGYSPLRLRKKIVDPDEE